MNKPTKPIVLLQRCPRTPRCFLQKNNAEKVIKDDILAKFPDHSILAEESGETASSSEYLWVIDPLDGTTNFVHGLSPYCVSIALLKNNKPLLSVISELPAENLYWAV